MIPLRILGVVIVSILTLIVISLSPIPVTFGTSVPQTVLCSPGSYLPFIPDTSAPAVPPACLPCPAGYYCPNPGMVGDPGTPGGPIPCPAGDSCPVGSIQPIAPIPEYPFGLAVIAIFMVLAYGVIRRKTTTKHK